MDRRSPILALVFLALALLAHSLSSPALSPAPAPPPSRPPLHRIMPEPIGSVLHPPPPPRSRQKQPIFRHRHRPPPLPPPPSGKLNLGKKLGFVFAAIAAFLQATFAAFLIYKRWQLKKIGRKCRMRASS